MLYIVPYPFYYGLTSYPSGEAHRIMMPVTQNTYYLDLALGTSPRGNLFRLSEDDIKPVWRLGPIEFRSFDVKSPAKCLPIKMKIFD
jgi:hypothetical protein